MQTEVEEKIANRECDQNMSVNRESYKTRRTPVFIRELVVSIEHPEDAECWEINLNELCNHEQTAWQEQGHSLAN